MLLKHIAVLFLIILSSIALLYALVEPALAISSVDETSSSMGLEDVLKPGRYVWDDNEVVLWSEDFMDYSVGAFPSNGGWSLVEPGKGRDYQVVVADGWASSRSLKLVSSVNHKLVVESPLTPIPRYAQALSLEITVRITRYSVGSNPVVIQLLSGDGGLVASIEFRLDNRRVVVNGVEIGEWVSDLWIPVRVTLVLEKDKVLTWIYKHLATTIEEHVEAITEARVRIVLPDTDVVLVVDSVALKATSGIYPKKLQRVWKTSIPLDTINSVDWSPDEEYIAIATEYSQKVIVYNKTGFKIWSSSDLGGHVFSVDWSPDGELLAAGIGWFEEGYHGKVVVFNRSGSIVWESEDLSGNVMSVSWSPDGGYIAVSTGYAHKVYVFTRSGSRVWVSKNLGKWVTSVDWSPDSKYVVAGLSDNKVVVLDNKGSRVWSADLKGSVWSVSWSPSGEYIVAGLSWSEGGTPHGLVCLLNSSSGDIIWESSDFGEVSSVSWSPDGRYIIAGLWHFNKFIIFDRGGAVLKKVGTLESSVVDVSWSLSGEYIAVSGTSSLIVFNTSILVSYFTITSIDNTTITLDASISKSIGININKYIWSFGDGENYTTTNTTIKHTYKKPGYYNVTLTVTSEENAIDSISTLVATKGFNITEKLLELKTKTPVPTTTQQPTTQPTTTTQLTITTTQLITIATIIAIAIAATTAYFIKRRRT